MDYRDYNRQFTKKQKKTKLVLIALLAVVAVLLSTVFLAHTTGENKGYRTISVVEVSGNVSVVKEGIEYRAYPGLLLQEGHEIVTSANSYVRLVLDDDKYVKLESGSRLIFETVGLLGSGKTQMRLERGALVTEITNPLGTEEEFVVNTPNAVLAVRGTFFRVDLNQYDQGEITADVMTYGGLVASSRVLPTGEKVEEEVLIDAGYKATINMTKEDTHYVVDAQPITMDDISDEDLIDVYFAVENGHELFVTTEEVKADLETREIDIEDQKSVYDKAKEVKKAQEAEGTIVGGTGNTTDVTVKADDSQPLVKVEESKPGEDKNDSTTTTPNTNTGTSGLVDGEHVHREKKTTVAATCTTDGCVVVTCRDCKETIRTTELPALGHDVERTAYVAPGCTTEGFETGKCKNCNEETTNILAATGHSEVAGNTKEAHSKCSTCNEILSTEHKLENTVHTVASCTEKGIDTYACECGYSYTNETAALGHTEVAGNTKEAHSKCSTCSEILSTEHTLVQTDKTAPSCTTAGVESYACACGYAYTNEIAALGHTEVAGNTKEVHSKCSTCNEVLSTEHTMENTVYKAPTCTEKGVDTYACNCGYTYSNEVAALGHTEVNGGSYDRHKVCTTCQQVTDANHVYRDEYVPPTCKDIGLINHYCDCGYVYSDIVDEKVPHVYKEEFQLDVAPTCTAPGSESRHCEVCNDKTDIREVPATGHLPMDGNSEKVHSICGLCNEVLSTEHEYTDTVVSVLGCETDGETKHVCSCGYTYTEIVEATGHTPENGNDVNVHTRCSVCSTILSTQHEMVNVYVKAPTCTEIGLSTYACDCGYTYTNETLALGHSEATSHKYETLGSPGYFKSYCSVCNVVFEEYEIPPVEALYVEDGDIIIRSDSYEQEGDGGGRAYDGEYYLIVQRDPSTEVNCTITIESGDKNVVLDGLNISTGGLVINSGATVRLNGKSHNVLKSASPVINNGTLKIEGGSFDLNNPNALDGYELNMYASIPLTSNRTFTAHDGTTYVYDIATEDASGEGYYYIWAPVGVTITSTVFEDPTILQYVEDNFDTDSDGFLTKDEISAATQLELTEGQAVTSLRGIEHLTSLQSLVIMDATDVVDEEVNLIKNRDLQSLTLKNLGATYLNLLNQPQLQNLTLDGSALESLDLSEAVSLGSLSINDCYYLTDLTASPDSGMSALGYISMNNCAALKNIDLSNTSLVDLDLTQCTYLEYLNISNSTIHTVDLTRVYSLIDFVAENFVGTELTVSYCSDLASCIVTNATNLTKLDLTGAEALQQIDLGTLTSLEELRVSSCSELTTLDTSSCVNLTKLYASGTGIQELDLTSNTEIYEVNVYGCTQLQSMDASNTGLWNLTVTGCTALEELNVSYSDISSLDLIGCTSLQTVNNDECPILVSIDISETPLTPDDINLNGGSLQHLTMNNCPNLPDHIIIGDGGIAPNVLNFEMKGSEVETLEINSSFLQKMRVEGAVGNLVFTKATKLTEVNLSQLTTLASLDVSGCTVLSKLTFTECDALKTLVVSGTPIESLDLTGCTELATLEAGLCSSLTLLDLSQCNALRSVNLSNTPFTMMSTAQSDGVIVVPQPTTPTMTYLNLSGTNINFSNCSVDKYTWWGALETLILTDANVTDADWNKINENPLPESLSVLYLANNSITELDLSGRTALTQLDISGCDQLVSLNVNGTNIEGLDINHALLSTLHVSNSGLKGLNIGNSSLTALELTSMPNLVQVSVEQSPLVTVTITYTGISESLVINDISTLESVVAADSTIGNVSVEGCSSLHTLNMAGTNAEDVSFFNSNNIEILDLSGTQMTAFELDGTKYTKITTLSLANCPDLASLSVKDCTTLTSLDVRGSDGIRTTFDVTNAGSASQSFTLITTAGDTYYTVDITGWDTLYMGMTTAP